MSAEGFSEWELLRDSIGASWWRPMDDIISPWHDNCPTDCMPCECHPDSIWLNKGKDHYYSHRKVCIFCGHSHQFITSWGPSVCAGHTLSNAFQFIGYPSRKRMKRLSWIRRMQRLALGWGPRRHSATSETA